MKIIRVKRMDFPRIYGFMSILMEPGAIGAVRDDHPRMVGHTRFRAFKYNKLIFFYTTGC